MEKTTEKATLYHLPGCATCVTVEEYLHRNGIEFVSVNPVGDEAGRQAWIEAGSPATPALKVAGRVVGILHVSQLNTLLGLSAPAAHDERRFAWDLLTLQDAWLGIVNALDFEIMTAPTASRSRSVRDLVPDVFEKIRKGEQARASARMVTVPDTEDVAQTLTDAVRIRDYVAQHVARWQAFLLEHYGDDGFTPGPMVAVSQQAAPGELRPREPMTYAGLLAFLRNHTAMHLRQITVALDRQGIAHPGDGLDAFTDLQFPTNVYGKNAEEMDRLAHHKLMTHGVQE